MKADDKIATDLTPIGPSRRESSLQLESARSFVFTTSASSKKEDGSARKKRMTLRQHQVKRVKSQLVETGGINDWNEYHAADEEEDEHFHYHTMHWVPVYETLDHSSQSRVAVIDTNIQVQCRITHARILCILPAGSVTKTW